MKQPAKEEKPKKAYSYVRFSTTDQRLGDSLERQVSRAKEYAAGNGLELDESLTFQDLGVSGFRGSNSRVGALGEFLEAVREGVVESGSVLLVESLDRISRQHPYDALGVLQQLVGSGITMVTLMGTPKTYSAETLRANPMALIEFVLIAARAHEESATKSDRAKRAWKSALKKAKQGEGRASSACPAWLYPSEDGNGWEVDKAKAKVVKSIFKMALAGKGKDSSAKALNEEGVPTFTAERNGKQAKRWFGSYIFRILSNPAVYGEHTPSEKIENPADGSVSIQELAPIPNYYPAVITKKAFQEIARLGGKAPRGRHAAAPVANPLAGLSTCPLCGGLMTRVNKGGANTRWSALVCVAAKTGKKNEAGEPVCKYKSVLCHRVESALHEQVGTILADCPDGSKKGREIDSSLANLDAAHSEVAEQLEQLLKLAKRGGDRTPEAVLREIQELEESRRALEGEMKILRQSLEGLNKTSVDARLADLKAALSKPEPIPGEVNLILKRLVSAVVVDYRIGQLVFRWHHSNEETHLIYDAAALFGED